jgi:hypothetical protein
MSALLTNTVDLARRPCGFVAKRVVSAPMPIPPLDEHGLLPPGVHHCTLEEIRARFGSFQESDRRPQLFARLTAFLSEAQAARLVASVVVDGSFVTAKPEPNDIDLIVVVAPGHSFAADLSPSEYAVLSKRRVHRRHGFDVLVARDDSEEYRRYVRFFQQIRFEPGRTKGILRLTL